MIITYLPKWSSHLIFLPPPYWGNNHLEPHTQHSTAFLFNMLSSCLYLFLKTMVIILVALKLIEKGTACNIFRISPFNIALLKFIYVAITSLYFIWILACIPLDDYTTVYPSTLVCRLLSFPKFLICTGQISTFLYVFLDAHVPEFILYVNLKE